MKGHRTFRVIFEIRMWWLHSHVPTQINSTPTIRIPHMLAARDFRNAPQPGCLEKMKALS